MTVGLYFSYDFLNAAGERIASGLLTTDFKTSSYFLNVPFDTNITFNYGIFGETRPTTPKQLLSWVTLIENLDDPGVGVTPSTCQALPQGTLGTRRSLLSRNLIAPRGNAICYFPVDNQCSINKATSQIALAAGTWVLNFVTTQPVSTFCELFWSSLDGKPAATNNCSL